MHINDYISHMVACLRHHDHGVALLQRKASCSIHRLYNSILNLTLLCSLRIYGIYAHPNIVTMTKKPDECFKLNLDI